MYVPQQFRVYALSLSVRRRGEMGGSERKVEASLEVEIGHPLGDRRRASRAPHNEQQR